MEEARFSLNIKYLYQGFDCQFTMRSDQETPLEHLERGQKAIAWLKAHDAVPTNGNGKPAAEKTPAAERLCPVCGQGDQLEHISFERDGKPRQAWKCQRCSKWLPDPK